MRHRYLVLLALVLSAACKKPSARTEWDVRGLDHPESIAFDAKRNRYLISNIGGAPDAEDRNGFITAIDSNGQVTEQRLFTTASLGVPLNAPKGIAIQDDMLYIADLTRIVVINLDNGRLLDEIQVGGAQFLNDIAVDKTSVWISDTKANALFRYQPAQKSLERLNVQGDLRSPNGLFGDESGSVWIAAWSGAVLNLSRQGALQVFSTTPRYQGLDGIQRLTDGRILVSDNPAGIVYVLSPQGAPTEILKGLEGPADFLLNGDLLLIPELTGNRVIARSVTQLLNAKH